MSHDQQPSNNGMSEQQQPAQHLPEQQQQHLQPYQNGQQQQQSQQQHVQQQLSHHFIPPAPAPAHDVQPLPALADSVVSDLMKVYESLTQTKQETKPSQDSFPMSQPVGATQTQAPQQQQYNFFETISNPLANVQSDADQSNGIVPLPVHHQQQQQQNYYTSQTATAYTPSSDPNQSVVHEQQQQQVLMKPPSATTTTTTSDSSVPTRSLRKRSLERNNSSSSSSNPPNNNKSRKKGASDGRWSKRFTWPDDLHRDFVSAIFDVGLKHSSPSAILEHMPKHDQITSERIKSHLQKYRLHRAKSKREFMTSYNASLNKFQNSGLDHVKSLGAGEVAAHATYCSTTTIPSEHEGSTTTTSDSQQQANNGGSSVTLQKQQQEQPRPLPPQQQQPNKAALVLPQLTEQEKKSPIGISLGHLMGLFFSLRQQLMAQRAQSKQVNSSNQQVSASAVGTGISNNNNNNTPHYSINNHVVVAPAPPPPHEHHNNNNAWTVPEEPTPPVIKEPTTSTSTKLDNNNNKQKTPPSTRSNLEENQMMKLEMQNQMAFQNKMRALKQQELNKYSRIYPPEQSNAATKKEQEIAPEVVVLNHQGAGEAAKAGDNNAAGRLSVGTSEEFWNTDVVDEQLFEFLMQP